MELTARLTAIRQETPSVKSFQLALERADFTFFPGQWIDLYIDRPGEGTLVGGFTIVSSPTQRGIIELAIKQLGGGRAAVHLHDHARVDDTFRIAGPSGDFYFQEGMSDCLVLVAGGIGINPFMSMVRYIDAAGLKVQTTLLYSAQRPSEILFEEELRAIATRNPLLRCHFTVTRPAGEPWQDHVGRIDPGLLRKAMPGRDALYYLCGPPGMPTAVAGMLRDLGIPAAWVRFEEW